MPANLLPNPADTPRLYALDAVRWLAFLAIVIYHSTFALWAPYGLNSTPPQNWSGQTLETLARTLATSGFFVLFLSFFLFGFRGSRKSTRLPVWLLAFALIWTGLVQTWPYYWDIYPFLICAIVASAFFRRLPKPEYIAIGAATFLLIPFWRLEAWLSWPIWIKAPLLGVCETRNDLGDWPLLPWLAYPILAESLGRLAARLRPHLQTISKPETGLWLMALALATPWLNKYYVTRIGEEFGCDIFRRPPHEFWAQQLIFLLIIRLSLLGRVQRYLSHSSVCTWLTHRPVNQAFFVTYFVHYPLVHLGAFTIRYLKFDFHPLALTVLVFGVILAIEAGAVVIRFGLKHNKLRESPWLRISAR